jgi:hypothetical protein
MKTCSYPTCERKHYSKGFCEIHYWRQNNGYPMDAPIKRVLHKLPLAQRLMERVEFDTNGGCWFWTGSADRFGYGHTSVGPKATDKAHRASYREFVGPIPPGAHVLHRCDIPACINPTHLFLGDQASNVADMVSKERQNRGEKNGQAKLTLEDVATIRSLRLMGYSYAWLAEWCGVSRSQVSRIINGKRWMHRVREVS